MSARGLRFCRDSWIGKVAIIPRMVTEIPKKPKN